MPFMPPNIPNMMKPENNKDGMPFNMPPMPPPFGMYPPPHMFMQPPNIM